MKAVDLFAGAGGWTEGATQAGVHVVAAVNHWAIAVESHKRNHPQTQHRCQDVTLLDPRELPDFDLLLASPACQGHSRARGVDRPHHDASRSSAWAVVDFVEVCRPRAFIVENVVEFKKWSLYGFWCSALIKLGYRLTENVLNAADFRVPQERVRLVVVGMLDRAPLSIVVPKHTHVSAESILDTKVRWTPINKPGRAAPTLARIAAGRKAFGSRFLMPYYKSGSGLTGRSLARPIGTITTKDRWAVVDGDHMRMISVDEMKRAMSFRQSYELLGTHHDQVKQLGNAMCPLEAKDIVQQVARAA